MKSNRSRVHPVTGELLKRDTRPFTVRYKGLERTVDQPGWYPEDNDEGILEGDDFRVGDRALAEIKAEIALLPDKEEVRRIRQRLGLSQRRAGEVLGGGPRAFQKYKSGEVVVSRPMANLLKLLDREPERLVELTSERAAA